MVMPDTALYRTRSQRVSDKFVSDMKISDEATKTKLRTAYYNRSKRYGMMHDKYKADSTGMAADMRQYNTDTDTEFKSILTDPAQYQSSRSTYDESNYLDDTNSMDAAAATTPADNSGSTSTPTDNSSMSDGDAVKSSKTKLEDGSKIKVKDDGTIKTKGEPTDGAALQDSKTKLVDGSKIKIKGDGTVKLKDADGAKTKM